MYHVCQIQFGVHGHNAKHVQSSHMLTLLSYNDAINVSLLYEVVVN